LANAAVSPHFERLSICSIADEVVGLRIADEALGEDGGLGDAASAGVAAAEIIVLPAAGLALHLGALGTTVADAQRRASCISVWRDF